MTIQELIDWCKANDVSLHTHIAVRAKDDYFITEDAVSIDRAYFGNSADGTEWEELNTPLDEHGNPDYDKVPKVVILDSFSG